MSPTPMDTPKPAAPAVEPSRNRVAKPNNETYAARYNRTALYCLEKALKKDPEANLADVLRVPAYTKQLDKWKEFRMASPHSSTTRSPHSNAPYPQIIGRVPGQLPYPLTMSARVFASETRVRSCVSSLPSFDLSWE
jgi:hypothetical protein